MGLIDFILNLAGLLLWLSWRSLRFDPLVITSPATLVGTLRRAEPQRLRGWQLLASLAALILLRALLYRQIGDLAVFQRCATSKAVVAAKRAACFVIDDDEAQRKNPRPLALKRR